MFTPGFMLEMMGYLASLLVLVSLLMSSVVKLRIINSVGAALFTAYGILIQSYPTAAMNFALIVVNMYFLTKVLRNKKLFSVEETLVDDNATQHFLRFYRDDISRCFPDYDFSISAGETCWLVYADANPVGLLIGEAVGDDTVKVSLDYACPSHRDCSVGQYLYGNLKEMGFTRLTAESHVERHSGYLKQMGFVEENGQFVKQL